MENYKTIYIRKLKFHKYLDAKTICQYGVIPSELIETDNGLGINGYGEPRDAPGTYALTGGKDCGIVYVGQTGNIKKRLFSHGQSLQFIDIETLFAYVSYEAVSKDDREKEEWRLLKYLSPTCKLRNKAFFERENVILPPNLEAII
jgi:hypothetical protein